MRTITFFSYKGGVGRTALAVNLAAELVRSRSARVLIVDWDLFAPGVEKYLRSVGRDDGGFLAECNPGVADFLCAVDESTVSEPAGRGGFVWQEVKDRLTQTVRNRPSGLVRPGRNADPLPIVQRIREETADLSVEERTPRKGDLRFIGPGTPEAILRCKSWGIGHSRLWMEAVGRYFVEEIRESWMIKTHLGRNIEEMEVPYFDFLFIDAPAGDGPLATLPPDFMFDSHAYLIGGLNNQNLEGLMGILGSWLSGSCAIPMDHLPTYVSLVHSPVPSVVSSPRAGRFEKRDDLLMRILRLAGTEKRDQNHPAMNLEALPSIYRIPYSPTLALKEIIITVDDPKDEYSVAVQEIAGHPVLKPRIYIPSYNMDQPPSRHPAALMPGWRWFVPEGMGVNGEEVFCRLVGAIGQSKKRAECEHLLNVLWWDWKLSDEKFYAVMERLRLAPDGTVLDDWVIKLVPKDGGGADQDRRLLLSSPQDAWAADMGSLLRAMFRFGEYVHLQLGLQSFEERFYGLLEEEKLPGELQKWLRWAPFWFYMGTRAAERDEFALAAKWMGAAVRLKPSHLESKRLEVKYLVEGGRYGEAQKCLHLIAKDGVTEYEFEARIAIAESCLVYLLDVPRGKNMIRDLLESDASIKAGERAGLYADLLCALTVVRDSELSAVLANRIHEAVGDPHFAIVDQNVIYSLLTFVGKEDDAAMLFRRLANAGGALRRVGTGGLVLIEMAKGATGSELRYRIEYPARVDDPDLWIALANGAMDYEQARQTIKTCLAMPDTTPRRIGQIVHSLDMLAYLSGCIRKRIGDKDTMLLEDTLKRNVTASIGKLRSSLASADWLSDISISFARGSMDARGHAPD